MTQQFSAHCYFLLTMDCERVQDRDFYPSGPLSWEESERNILSFAEIADKHGYKATFFAVPEAAERHARIFKDLIGRGHEVGLHLHPNTFRFGINEYLGNLPYNIQYDIIKDAADAFYNAMGFQPTSFRAGYFSANQDTFRVLEALKFKRGSSAIPGRHLVRSGGDWKQWPRYCRYIDSFFEVPVTIQYVNIKGYYLFCLKNMMELIFGGFAFAAIKRAASLSGNNSPFSTGGNDYLIDLRIEYCDYHRLRRIISADIERMRNEKNFPVITSLTHSYINYTGHSYGKREYGLSRKKSLQLLLGHMNKRQDVTIISKTISELQCEYDNYCSINSGITLISKEKK